MRDLAPLMRAAAHRCDVRRILHGRHAPAAPAKPPAPRLSAAPVPLPARETAFNDVSARMNRLADPGRPELILIGSSTGGPAALARILPEIPGDIGVPVLVVQHMPPVFTKSLAENLAPKCAVRVVEASHGERALPNTVYIAPGGQQMRLGCSAGERPVLEITDDPPENNCRPAVDYLFRSAAGSYPGRTLAVILTGMGSDGAQGLRALKRQGCYVIAQDEPSCIVYGMPKAAVDAGVVDMVLPLDQIAARIAARIRGGRA